MLQKLQNSLPFMCYPDLGKEGKITIEFSIYTVHGILQARILQWVSFPFSRGSSYPGIKPRSLILQADSLPAELQGKPNNTGVGSLSLLQRIFPSQELNRGLLHCRRIHYQLRYQGSPYNSISRRNFSHCFWSLRLVFFVTSNSMPLCPSFLEGRPSLQTSKEENS